MKKLILGIFSKHEDADEALFHLKEAGFDSDEMSIIAREDTVKKYRSKDSGGDSIVTGGILGGLAGILLTAVPIVLPGIGILVAGPLTILTGLAVGAVTGGVIGTLVSIGVSENQAKSYEKHLQKGGVLLTVPVSDKSLEKAQKILENHNAQELTIIPYTEKAEIARSMHV